ncbi:MAG: HlyD family efflux transporter periplasmic adaptor subunit [Bryobacteraceae bacterium]|jgi:HlyD family secretion protein
MDIPRKNSGRNRLIKRIVFGTVALAAVGGVSAYLYRLKPAAPSVDKGAVWMDTVKRGQMLREVRGLGTLVPEEIVHIQPPYDGLVAQTPVLAGINVTADTVLVELRNRDMEQQEVDAKSNLQTAEAELANLKAQNETSRLNQRADQAALEADYKNAKAKSEHDEILYKQGLLLELDYNVSKTNYDALATRYAMGQERGKALADSLAAQLAAKETSVQQMRNLVQLRQDQLSTLRVRAGVSGVLQQVLVQSGQRVGPGTDLAIVVQPKNLKAELKTPETQAKDVQIGQLASIDTRNGVIQGKVSRIDPSVREGSVVVDVRLEGTLPPGARPDLSVDGTIQIERLDNVVYVGKPANAAENGATELFRLNPDGKEATRVKVRLGRSSVNVIEVLEGLQVGDRVILSDMSQYDGYDRVRLN